MTESTREQKCDEMIYSRKFFFKHLTAVKNFPTLTDVTNWRTQKISKETTFTNDR